MLTLRQLFQAGAICVAACVTANSQSSASVSGAVTVAGVHYRCWTEQLLQWVGPELPYSTIVANLDDRGKQPVCDIQMVSKDGKTAVHYTNSAQQFAFDQKVGLKVFQVPIHVDSPGDPTKGAQYQIRFNTENNVPVVWQFVVGTDVTERGSGVSAANPGYPALVYREQGGFAGGGSALKVGSGTSVAEPWKEIDQPPYFVPYRGTIATSVQTLNFTSASNQSNSAANDSPNQPNASAQTQHSGDTTTVTDQVFGTTVSYTSAGAATRVSFAPLHAKVTKALSLQISPALAMDQVSNFDVMEGKKNKIASGTVQVVTDKDRSPSEEWKFSSPDGLRGLQVDVLLSASTR